MDLETVQQVRRLVLGDDFKCSKEDQCYCDDECIQRYLRARKQDPKLAAKLLKCTLQWRKEYKVGQLHCDQFAWALEAGRMYLAGYDSQKHPIMVTRKNADRVDPSLHQEAVRHLVFTLETAVRAMPAGQEKWVWIMDMKGYSRQNSPPLSISLQTLRILSDHYPERLYRVYFVDAPTVFWVLKSALWPFVDPVTREKVVFVYSKDVPAPGQPLPEGASPQLQEFCAEYLSAYQTPYNEKAYRELLDSLCKPELAESTA